MLRAIYFVAGWSSVMLAVAGAFLPLLPCTPFALLAAFCFARSSPRAMRWLGSSPLLGSALRDWQRHRGLRLRAKLTAMALALSAPAITLMVWPPFSVSLCLSLLGASIALLVICRLPTIRHCATTVPPLEHLAPRATDQKPLAA
jgi:uncharacterized protein